MQLRSGQNYQTKEAFYKKKKIKKNAPMQKGSF